MKTERNTSMDNQQYVELPPMFSSRGAFTPWDEQTLASVDDATRDRYCAVQSAHAESVAADDELKAAEGRVVSLVKDVRDAESFVRDNWPPMSAVDAARAAILTQRLTRG
jgi:hypothetical protein